MNNTLKGLLILLLGAGIGSLVTYQRMKEKCEQELADQYNSIIEEVQQEIAAASKHYETTVNVKGSENVTPEYIESIKSYDKFFKENAKPALDELVSNKSLNPGAYIVDEESYNVGAPEFEKATLTYYAQDDVLTDEDDAVVTDVAELIGDSLLCFGENKKDPNLLYVRNESYVTDFEVIRVDKSYEVTVLGMTQPEEPPRKKAKNGRTRENE